MPSRKCEYQLKNVGRCQQVGHRLEHGGAKALFLCRFHAQWQDLDDLPDAYYHAKVVKGLLTPTFDFLSEEEVSTLFYGRKRQDGRRLDAWALNDPLEWKPAA